MALPTFIIFGARKAGTTSLYHYLNQHPEIFMSELKGSRFFLYDSTNPDTNSNITIKNIVEFEHLFDKANQNKVRAIGEATPSYITSAFAAKQIKKVIPKVLLIASLRNPVDRVYSMYQMQMRNRKESEQVPFTIDNLENWTEDGFYYKQLINYFEIFDPDQIRIIIFEKWINNPVATIKDIYEFLGVKENFSPDISVKYNVGGSSNNKILGELLKPRKIYIKLKPIVPGRVRSMANRFRNMNMKKAPSLPDDLRKHLGEIYLEDIQELESLIKEDLSIWKNANL